MDNEKFYNTYFQAICQNMENKIKNAVLNIVSLKKGEISRSFLKYETKNECLLLADVDEIIKVCNETSIQETSNLLLEAIDKKQQLLYTQKEKSVPITSKTELFTVNHDDEIALLTKTPHYNFLDLSVCFCNLTYDKDDFLISIEPCSYIPELKNNFQLYYENVFLNTLKKLKIGIFTAEEYTNEENLHYENHYTEYDLSKIQNSFFIQTKGCNNVGFCLLLEDLWKFLGEHFKKDLLIVPVTTYELLVMEYSDDAFKQHFNILKQNSEELKTINKSLFLSQNCYIYQLKTNTIVQLNS